MINFSSSIFISDFENFNIKDKQEDSQNELSLTIKSLLKLSDNSLTEGNKLIEKINYTKHSNVNNNIENKIINEIKQEVDYFINENIRQIDDVKEEKIKNLKFKMNKKRELNVGLIDKLEYRLHTLKDIERVINYKLKEGKFI